MSLNIIQTYLARGEYANAMEYLNRMPGLIEKMKRKDIPVRPELTMLLSVSSDCYAGIERGRRRQPLIAEADKFYHEKYECFSP